ncbi:MAG: AzlD domain-containing protein [Hyphomicrobiales bacterium]
MNWLNLPFSEWSPYLFILLAGGIPTQIWRTLGVFLSRSMDENSEVLKWVKAVATALVAGLIANLVIFPSGGLAVVPLWARVGALMISYVVFLKTRPRLLLAILAGEALLIGATLLYS